MGNLAKTVPSAEKKKRTFSQKKLVIFAARSHIKFVVFGQLWLHPCTHKVHFSPLSKKKKRERPL